MASEALRALLDAMAEIRDLQRADPTLLGAMPADPEVARVVGRASVVLLSSHFERFVYSLNEEAIRAVNSTSPLSILLPQSLRLLHTKPHIDLVATSQWDQPGRAQALSDFARSEVWLWKNDETGALTHDRLLVWMKAPTPRNLVRYFKYWDIPDIFAVASAATDFSRQELWLSIDGLVSKRNAIAHGDTNVEATKADVGEYLVAVDQFCRSVDTTFATQVAGLLDIDTPW